MKLRKNTLLIIFLTLPLILFTTFFYRSNKSIFEQKNNTHYVKSNDTAQKPQSNSLYQDDCIAEPKQNQDGTSPEFNYGYITNIYEKDGKRFADIIYVMFSKDEFGFLANSKTDEKVHC